MDKIEVDAGLFEMILNSLDSQKFIQELDKEDAEDTQRVIDETWNSGMEVLREYHITKHSDDIKSKLSKPAPGAVEAGESFEEGGPRVIADMDWTVEQRKEIMVILGGLSAEWDRSKAIVDPGYREWGQCGMLNKCAQLIELKVGEWDKSEGSCSIKGYVEKEVDTLRGIEEKSDYQRGKDDAFRTVLGKCFEICGG